MKNLKVKKNFAIAAGFAFLAIICLAIGLQWHYKQRAFFADAIYNNPRIEFIMNRALRSAIQNNVASEEAIRDYLQSYGKINLIQENNSWIKNGSARAGTLTISISDPNNFNIALHEAVHIALFAIDVPRERHHRIMLQRNWCFGGVCED